MTNTIKTEVLATIDELNQYLNGNVTRNAAMIALSLLLVKLDEEQTKEQKQFEADMLEAFGADFLASKDKGRLREY